MASSFSHPESVPNSSLKTRSRKAQEKSRIQTVLKFSKAEPLGLRVRGSTSKTRSERECSSPEVTSARKMFTVEVQGLREMRARYTTVISIATL